MKKMTILLCGGLIALTSCNDSIYQDIDEQNNDMYAPPTFNNDEPGFAHGDDPLSGLIWVGDDYASPWDIWFRTNNYGGGNIQPSYMMSNGNMESITSYYNLEVFAYIGLAYFDGDDNGIFYDIDQPPSSPGAPGQLIADMFNNPGLFPNLYASGHEVGNLVKTVVPIQVNAYPDPFDYHGFRIEDKDKHLLITPGPNTPKYPMYPQWDQTFDFTGSTLTFDEVELLRTYGKVFFYEVNVYDKITNAPVLLGQIMHPKIETLYNPTPNTHWQPVMSGTTHVQGNAPGLGLRDLYYYYDASLSPAGTVWTPMGYKNNKCDSREVVFYVPENLHTIPIPGGLNTLHLGIAQSSRYLWLNSALYLRVE